jgi:hypothetical protein
MPSHLTTRSAHELFRSRPLGTSGLARESIPRDLTLLLGRRWEEFHAPPRLSFSRMCAALSVHAALLRPAIATQRR